MMDSYILVVDIRKMAVADHFFRAWAAEHLIPFSMFCLLKL
jgi:hypothetical protein